MFSAEAMACREESSIMNSVGRGKDMDALTLTKFLLLLGERFKHYYVWNI